MDEILINMSTLGSQTQPAITGFRSTQFIAVWEDLNDGNIRGQMLSPDGTKTSNEFLVNVPDKPNTKRQRPAIVETPLGSCSRRVAPPQASGSVRRPDGSRLRGRRSCRCP